MFMLAVCVEVKICPIALALLSMLPKEVHDFVIGSLSFNTLFPAEPYEILISLTLPPPNSTKMIHVTFIDRKNLE